MTDNEKVQAMMKDLGLVSYRDIAKITGHTYGYVKFILQPKMKIPRWVKLVLYAWENSENKELHRKQKKALETIRDAFWSDNETAEEKVEDLKSIACNALTKNNE